MSSGVAFELFVQPAFQVTTVVCLKDQKDYRSLRDRGLAGGDLLPNAVDGIAAGHTDFNAAAGRLLDMGQFKTTVE